VDGSRSSSSGGHPAAVTGQADANVTSVSGLDGCRAKIARAAEHKAALEAAIDEWLSGQPFALEGRAEPGSNWFMVTFRERKAPPLRLGTIFGDFVSNLESALDLLIYQLVLASGKTPGSGNYFPIVTLPDRWASARQDKLKGVSDPLAERIRLVQPFNDGFNAHLHWLSILHCANKVNKHHVVIPTTISSTTGWQLTYELNRNAQTGDEIMHDLDPPGAGTVLKEGQVLARLRAISPSGDLRITRIQEIGAADVGIGFDLPIKLSGKLPDFIVLAEGVIDEFEQILGA